MNWIKTVKAVSIFTIVFLLSVKASDLLIGALIHSAKERESLVERSISLREHPINTDKLFYPDAEYIKTTDSLLQQPYRLRTDGNGFIIGEKDLTEHFSNRNPNIIFFGGSTTECLFVDEDHRFPYLVSRNLLDRSNQEIKVLNGGFSGSHSIHSSLAHLAKGLSLEPTHVILMHAINDLTTLSKAASYWDGPSSRGIIKINNDKQQNQIIAIGKTVKNLLFPNIWKSFGHLFLVGSGSGNTDEWNEYRGDKASYEYIERVVRKNFTSSLKMFVRVNRAWGIEPILMTQFNRLTLTDAFVKSTYEKLPQSLPYNEFVKLYTLTNQIIRDVAREEHVVLIDLDKEVPSSPDFIYDSVHLNNAGSDLVAKIISRKLFEKFPKHFQLKQSEN